MTTATIDQRTRPMTSSISPLADVFADFGLDADRQAEAGPAIDTPTVNPPTEWHTDYDWHSWRAAVDSFDCYLPSPAEIELQCAIERAQQGIVDEVELENFDDDEN